MPLDSVTLATLAAAAGVVLLLAFRRLKSKRMRMQLPDLLSAGAVVVDVRSPGEFTSGARRGSINIPLDRLPHGLKRLNPAKPVIVCCATGARSAMAERMLRQAGFAQVLNAGSWVNVPELG